MSSRPQETVTFNSLQFTTLKELVAQGEGDRLEFKRKAAHPEKIVREMVAFANTQGGTLLLGVDDNGSIPGLKYPEDESHVIRQALRSVQPALKIRETFIPVSPSRIVIQYDIPESKRKLHYMLNADQKESFVRVQDKSIKASREVREILRRSQRQSNIRFSYGDHEKFLFNYLEENTTITVKKFMELRNLKRFYASKKLVLLVLANVLEVTPHEKGDLFSRCPC